MKATIFDIQRNSFVDGPGIRTTVFFKGCNLRCKWCHNPESQCIKPQMMFHKNKGMEQICGKEYTTEEILEEVMKDKVFYEMSGGGVTFSGGECMLQIDFLEEVLRKCKDNGIHTAVDTAGNIPWEHFERIIPFTDLFLYDVKCFSEDLHMEGTGVSNKTIFENLESLSKSFEGDIIIRIPVIPGFNETTEEMQKIADFLKNISYNDIELLPYHKMGEHKYDALNMKLTSYAVPEKENMERLYEIINKIH